MKIRHALLLSALMSWAFIAPSVLAQKIFDTNDYKVRAVTLVPGLANPWGLAFLPDGRMLVTERAGRMRVIDGGKLVTLPISGLPAAVEHGQGGMLDVVLHPKYAETGWIYWTYNAGVPGAYGTEVARGKLAGTREAPAMTDVQVLFKLDPKSGAGQHFGSRIVFDRALFIAFIGVITAITKGDNHEARAIKHDARAEVLPCT